MKRSVLACSGVTALLLSACSGNGPSNLKVHEVNLSGGTQERVTWVYGNLNGGSKSSVKLGGAAVELRPQISDPLATPGSLSINGAATYRTPTAPAQQKLSLSRDADGQFTVTALNGASLAAVYHTDGTGWVKLSRAGGLARAQASAGLRGVGQLTDAEADVLAGVLQLQGPLTVAVLNDPTPAQSVEPQATETLRTSLYILPGAPTAVLAGTGTTTGTVTTTPGTGTAPVPAPRPANGGNVSGTPVNFSVVAQGTNAATSSPSVQVATTSAQAAALYALAYGRQTSVPRPPALNGNTLVGIFIGQRSSGGYSVEVAQMAASGSTLNLSLNLSAPGPGTLTTMALTSPWIIVSVPGRYTAANATNLPTAPGDVR